MVVYKKFDVSSTDKSFEPYEVNGYRISHPLVAAGGGNCKWGFAKKYGKEFFIKEFLSPKYPDQNIEISDAMRKIQIRECNEWFEMHSRVYRAILKNAGGNLILPLDFFRFQNHFYLVTEKIESNGMKFDDIYRKSMEQRHMLLKVLAYEFSCLAESGVVHSDVKPDNLILKSTIDGYFTVKIIDFDGSFLSNELPDPDSIIGDSVYYSPEAILYMIMEEGEITPKADIFALGIVFHQILCGKLPQYDTEQFASIGETVLNKQEVILSNQISCEYQELIQSMLYVEAKERPSAAQVFQRLCWIETSWNSDPVRRPDINDSMTKPKKLDEKKTDSESSGSSNWHMALDLE